MSKKEMNNPQMELASTSQSAEILEKVQNATAVYNAMKELKATIADNSLRQGLRIN